MADRVIKCKECGGEFVFTSGEQKFYSERGFTEPKRCKECREKRKAARES